MKTLFTAFVAFSFAFSLPANAVEIPGHDSPAFQTALQDWLDGKDRVALTQLAALARQDNRAAQIFLARVAEETHLHNHVTGSLPRAERVALLRQPGELSGESWLNAAQEEVPLAKALLQASGLWEREAAGPTLLDYGEITLALRLVNTLLVTWHFAEARQSLELMDSNLSPVKVMMFAAGNRGAIEQPRFGHEEHRFKHQTDPLTGVSVVDQLSVISVVDLLSVYPVASGGFFEDNRYREIVLSDVVDIPEYQPAVNWCRTNCAESVSQCVVAASFGGIDQYGPFSSPLESLVPNETYWSSPRVDSDIARRTPDLTQFGNHLRNFDACFVDKMTALQARVR